MNYNLELLKSIIGADEVSRLVEKTNLSYPPYNIERTDENNITISIALAGFAPEDIVVTVNDRELTIKGTYIQKEANYVHKGIPSKSFSKTFILSEYVTVKDASLVNGLLTIKAQRVLPESAMPRQIVINTTPKVAELPEAVDAETKHTQ